MIGSGFKISRGRGRGASVGRKLRQGCYIRESFYLWETPALTSEMNICDSLVFLPVGRRARAGWAVAGHRCASAFGQRYCVLSVREGLRPGACFCMRRRAWKRCDANSISPKANHCVVSGILGFMSASAGRHPY